MFTIVGVPSLRDQRPKELDNIRFDQYMLVKEQFDMFDYVLFYH